MAESHLSSSIIPKPSPAYDGQKTKKPLSGSSLPVSPTFAATFPQTYPTRIPKPAKHVRTFSRGNESLHPPKGWKQSKIPVAKAYKDKIGKSYKDERVVVDGGIMLRKVSTPSVYPFLLPGNYPRIPRLTKQKPS